MRLFHKTGAVELNSSGERESSLAYYLGRYVVLYFFPKANSPGCTREARDFSALADTFEKLDSVVIGVSPDSNRTQSKFIQSKKLKLPLFPDPKLKLAQEFGAVREDGRLLRSTFLFDRSGVLRWSWRAVRVDGHVHEVLSTLQALHEADQGLNPLLATRRAKRALSSQPVPKGELIRLVEAAHLAPSCFNNQPWRFVVVRGRKLAPIREALPGGNYWAKPSPAVIAVVSHRDFDCKLSDQRDYFLFGAGLAVQNMLIQATQMGLIAHPIAGYDPVKVKKALKIPEDHILITLVIVGRPGDIGHLNEKHRELELGPRDRKPLDAVLAWNHYTFEE